MEKDKGCKITKPDKIGEEKIPKKKFAHGNLFLPQKIVIWKKIKDVK